MVEQFDSYSIQKTRIRVDGSSYLFQALLELSVLFLLFALFPHNGRETAVYILGCGGQQQSHLLPLASRSQGDGDARE